MASRDPFENITLDEAVRPQPQPAPPIQNPFDTIPDPFARARQGLDPFDAAGYRDAGVEDVGWLRRIKSFGSALLGGAAQVGESTLRAPGAASALDETEYREFSNLSPEERTQTAFAKTFRALTHYAESSRADYLMLHGFSVDEAIEKAKLLSPEEQEQAPALMAARAHEVFEKIEQLEKENVVPGFWTETLPHAVGTTAAIGTASIAAGVGSRGLIPPWAVAGYLGASLGADEAINDAVQNGATAGQARIAAGVGTLLGTTEAIPITRILDRVDTATGGAISTALDRVFKQKLVGSVLKEGLKGAFEEGLQEAVQSIGMDTVAAFTYDPEREITNRMVDNALAGGGTGFILSAVATALGIPLRNRQQQQVRKEFLTREVERITGQPVDPLIVEAAISRGAKFSPITPMHTQILTDLAAILDRVEYTTSRLRQDQTLTVNELMEEFNQQPGRREGLGGYGVNLIASGLSTSTFENNLEVFNVNHSVETGLVGVKTAAEAITKQPVVVTGFNHFQQRAAQLRNEIQDLLFEGPSSQEIELKRDQLRSLESLARTELVLAKDLKNVVAGIRSKFFSPDTKIVLSDDQFSKNSHGAAWSDESGKLIHVGVSWQAISRYSTPNRVVYARETLLHELGHALVFQQFKDMQIRVMAATTPETEVAAMLQSLPSPNPLTGPSGRTSYWLRIQKLQQEAAAKGKKKETLASNKDIILFKGIMQEYLTWAGNRIHSPFLQRFLDIAPPTFVEAADAPRNSESPLVLGKPLNYWYNFDEFMADNFARVAVGREYVTEEVKNFFQSQRALLEKMYAPYAQQEMMPVVEDWIKFMSLEGKLEKILSEAAKRELDWYSFFGNNKLAKELGLNEDAFSFREDMDNYWRWYSFGLNILQLGKLNEQIEPLQRYIRTAQRYNQKINEFRWRGHNGLQQWRALGRKQAGIVAEIMYEETLEEVRLTPDELKAKGLNEDGAKVLAQIRADFAEVLNRMEKVLLNEVYQNFYNDPVLLEKELKRVREEVSAMRSKPFFPLMRFGRYTVQVRALEDFDYEGRSYKKGQLVEFLTYESQRARAKDNTEVRGRWKHEPVSIGEGYLSDAEVAVQGMQGPLLRSLRKSLSDQGQLTPEMEKALDGMLQDALPIHSFRKHFARRRKVAGFSTDAMRSYAAYMVQAATHLSRIEHQAELNRAVNDIARDAKEIAALGGYKPPTTLLGKVRDRLFPKSAKGRGTKRGQIAEFTRKHLDYMMSPANDWPMLRSIGFAWFLGFNLKSALVNSTQLLMATHPYLAARYGDLAAAKEMSKTTALVRRYWKGEKVSQEVQELMAIGKKEGWLDESLATELAVARSSRTGTEMLPVAPAMRAWTKFSEIAAWPFHTVEKMNRLITAVSAHQLAKKAGFTHQQAIALAKESVQATQGEYQRWARPRMMTGKIGSNALLFKNFQQIMLFLALGNDPAKGRVLFMMLIMAGLMGLPFAEDLLDLFDTTATQLKKMLGWNNPKVQSRQMIRETLLELQMNPDLFMYGLGENSMGLGYLGDLAGVPFPELDLQGSLSAGNVLPATQTLKRFQEGEYARGLLQAMEELGGAEASYMADVASALVRDNPDQWKRWEQALPSALKGISRAARYVSRGGEFTERGQPIAEFDRFDAESNMEVYAQMLGFTPSKTSRGWESYIAQREIVVYYQAQSRSLLRDHNYSRLYEDPEDASKALQAIRDYNKTVPYPELKIGADTIRNSLNEFARQRALSGQSIPVIRDEYRLTREIRELYEEE